MELNNNEQQGMGEKPKEETKLKLNTQKKRKLKEYFIIKAHPQRFFVTNYAISY